MDIPFCIPKLTDFDCATHGRPPHVRYHCTIQYGSCSARGAIGTADVVRLNEMCCHCKIQSGFQWLSTKQRSVKCLHNFQNIYTLEWFGNLGLYKACSSRQLHLFFFFFHGAAGKLKITYVGHVCGFQYICIGQGPSWMNLASDHYPSSHLYTSCLWPWAVPIINIWLFKLSMGSWEIPGQSENHTVVTKIQTGRASGLSGPSGHFAAWFPFYREHKTGSSKGVKKT